jgi:hypothetical protein
MQMTDSRQLSGLIGPTMIAIGVTEAMNINAFGSQTPSVVYLNGAILFTAGLAIVRTHNLWTWRWPVLVTLSGWAALAGGLWRMAAPAAPQASEGMLTYAVLAALDAIGLYLSVKGFAPQTSTARPPADL